MIPMAWWFCHSSYHLVHSTTFCTRAQVQEQSSVHKEQWLLWSFSSFMRHTGLWIAGIQYFVPGMWYKTNFLIVHGYLVDLLSTGVAKFYYLFAFHELFDFHFWYLCHSYLTSFHVIYQTLARVFHHVSKHWERKLKNEAQPSVWYSFSNKYVLQEKTKEKVWLIYASVSSCFQTRYACDFPLSLHELLMSLRSIRINI